MKRSFLPTKEEADSAARTFLPTRAEPKNGPGPGRRHYDTATCACGESYFLHPCRKYALCRKCAFKLSQAVQRQRPEYKAKAKAKNQRLRADPVYRAKEIARISERRRNDPKAMEKAKKQWKAWREANKEHKHAVDKAWWARHLADPENRRKHYEKNRAYHKARAEAIKADPVKHAEYLAKRRERYARKQLRKNARTRNKAGAPRVEVMLQQIQALIPRSVDPQVRGDLCNEIAAAILAGDTTLDRLQQNPKALRKFTAKAHRLIAETWNQSSLDDVIPGTDGLTYADALPEDAPHF